MMCVYKTCLYNYKVYIFNLNVTFLITTAQTDLSILDKEPDLEHIHKFLKEEVQIGNHLPGSSEST